LVIDLNADAGESFGAYTLGRDAELFAQITSLNVACGFHAGDPQTMLATLELAAQHRLNIGAHPSFPDLVGFGRREMQLLPKEIYTDVLYQISALAGMAKTLGLGLSHVKPHGALYNQAMRLSSTAKAIAQAVRNFDPNLRLFGLPNSPLEQAALECGLVFVPEGFPERGYLASGQLAPRQMAGASIHDPVLAAARAVQMAQGEIHTLENTIISCKLETLCIHGDNPNAPEIAKAIRQALEIQATSTTQKHFKIQ
jgi:5-oxoprolinase (ATP-hydrolysing) subunit A